MSLEPSGSRSPRRAREQRAYTLVMVGGGAGIAGVVGLVLAAIGVIGFGVPFLLIIVAAICAFMFRRTVSS